MVRRGEAADRRREPEWTAAGVGDCWPLRRRACRQSASQTADNGFVPAVVVPDVRPAVPTSSGRIEIVMANRRRMIVDGGVDIAALCQLVEALERR
jgi:hypothetical protein